MNLVDINFGRTSFFSERTFSIWIQFIEKYLSKFIYLNVFK